jgi:DNA-binding MarR family transcriptional regulator
MQEIGKTRLIILFAVHDGSLCGWPASISSLSRLTGTQISNVWNHLNALEAEGLIRRERDQSGRVGRRTAWPTFRFITPEELEGSHAV